MDKISRETKWVIFHFRTYGLLFLVQNFQSDHEDVYEDYHGERWVEFDRQGAVNEECLELFQIRVEIFVFLQTLLNVAKSGSCQFLDQQGKVGKVLRQRL